MRISRLPSDVFAEICSRLPALSRVCLRVTCWEVLDAIPWRKLTRLEHQDMAVEALSSSQQLLREAISMGLAGQITQEAIDAACARDDCLGVEHLRATCGIIPGCFSRPSYVVAQRLFLWRVIPSDAMFVLALERGDLVTAQEVFDCSPGTSLVISAIMLGSDGSFVAGLLQELPAELWNQRLFKVARGHRAAYVFEIAARKGIPVRGYQTRYRG